MKIRFLEIVALIGISLAMSSANAGSGIWGFAFRGPVINQTNFVYNTASFSQPAGLPNTAKVSYFQWQFSTQQTVPSGFEFALVGATTGGYVVVQSGALSGGLSIPASYNLNANQPFYLQFAVAQSTTQVIPSFAVGSDSVSLSYSY